MSKAEVVLLDLKESPFAVRVRIALAEKGLAFESIPQDLWNKSELLFSNPVYKKVPVLLHGDRPPLYESLIILSYVDEEWPSPPLLPSATHERATARFWADFVDRTFFPALVKICRNKGPGEELESDKKEVVEALKKFEEFMGDKNFFGGDSFGFVDAALIPFASWTYGMEKIAGFNEKIPKLTSWIERCLAKESVANEMPSQEEVCDILCKVRKTLGLISSSLRLGCSALNI